MAAPQVARPALEDGIGVGEGERIETDKERSARRFSMGEREWQGEWVRIGEQVAARERERAAYEASVRDDEPRVVWAEAVRVPKWGSGRPSATRT